MTLRFLIVFAFTLLAFSAFAADGSTEIDVAVLRNDVARGEIIAEADLEYKAIPQMRANASVARAITDVAGMEARRALKAGDLIRTNDLKRPTLVAKGSTVTMLFEAPGMRLSAVGRALAEGAEGDTITILNPTSYRKVEAVVIKAGTVRVGAFDIHAASGQSETAAGKLAAGRP
jgi:flagella basal body P-ring formation protein FlgA